MNDQDDVSTWEDITTSLAEARPLLTNFEMLEETVEQQRRATRLTMLMLVTLLCVVVGVLVLPNSLSFSIREPFFAVGVVIAFGLVSTSVVYFNLAACAKNAQTARRSLERELQDAEHSVSTSFEGRSQESQSAGGGAYAT